MERNPPVYLDHNASTPLHPAALEVMLPWLTDGANPSSIHAAGRSARRATEAAREEVASLLGASPAEIVFTSGGTEADNLAIRGAARAACAARPSRREIAISAAEHPAVREAALGLEREGFAVHELPVDPDGLQRPESADALTPRLAVLSLILANNETGAIDDAVPVLARRAHELGTLVHTDAVQAAGRIPVDVRALGVDLLSLSAHKLGGPKGVGALYVRKGTRLEPLAAGGGQEKGRRPGTENVAGIVGLAAAFHAASERLAEEADRLAALRDTFERELLERVPGVRFNATSSPATRRLPSVSSAVFPGAEGETLLMALDLEGIAASTGSACASGTTAPSRVLLACGLPREDVLATLRFSFGRTTSEADVARVLDVLPPLVARARAALSLTG
ncbi:MAG TPA: cysteine desulfurase family protein [Thermoanaerobaculia bacterium]|nr:cysteine desulfurase family protein [Thermoanaerobaculia bacterium]